MAINASKDLLQLTQQRCVIPRIAYTRSLQHCFIAETGFHLGLPGTEIRPIFFP